MNNTFSLDKLLDRLKSEESSLVKLVSDLVKIPSVNPPGDMSEIAGFIRDYLDSVGISYKIFEPSKGVITIYSRIGLEEDRDYLHFNGHMDVVPVGDEDKWHFPPFSGKVVDGYIYGRGASDMKAGLAVLIKVFEIIARYWEGMPKSLSISIVPDEETGGKLGSKYLVEKIGIRPKYVIISEPSTIECVEVGEKGIMQYRVKVKGIPKHASISPYVGENAILKACEIAKKIYKLVELEFKPPEELRDIVESSGELIAKRLNNPSLKRIFKSLSCNLGLIKGGVKTNVVAPNAEMDFDMRIPPGLTVRKVLDMVNDIVRDYKDSVDIKLLSGEDPTYTNPNSPVVNAICEAARVELGVNIQKSLVTGATDGRHFRAYGAEVAVYGPGEWGTIHGYNERVKIDDIKISARVILRAAYNLLST